MCNMSLGSSSIHDTDALVLLQGVITLTMNERFNLDGGYLGLLQWILGDHSGHWVGFAVRDVLLSAERYVIIILLKSFL